MKNNEEDASERRQEERERIEATYRDFMLNEIKRVDRLRDIIASFSAEEMERCSTNDLIDRAGLFEDELSRLRVFLMLHMGGEAIKSHIEKLAAEISRRPDDDGDEDKK